MEALGAASLWAFRAVRAFEVSGRLGWVHGCSGFWGLGVRGNNHVESLGLRFGVQGLGFRGFRFYGFEPRV